MSKSNIPIISRLFLQISIALIFVPMVSAVENMTVGDILSLIEARDAMIESASMTIRVTLEYPEIDKGYIQKDIFYARKDGQMAVTVDTTYRDGSTINNSLAFNGEKMLLLSDNVPGHVTIHPSIDFPLDVILLMDFEPMKTMYYFAQEYLPGATVEVSLDGTDIIDGTECLVLIHKTYGTEYPIIRTERYYFDIENDFAFKQSTSEYNDSNIRHISIVKDTFYVDVGRQELAVPAKAEKRLEKIDTGQITRKEKFEILALEVNTELPDALFSPELAPGTEIWDSELNIYYIVGPNGEWLKENFWSQLLLLPSLLRSR